MSSKEFKPVVGYEGFYEINPDGDVKSLERVVPHFRGGLRVIKEKILSGSLDAYGYKVVSISNMINKKVVKVHRLVAEAFIENPENKKTVNHINRIKSDNNVKNLEWNTVRENSTHRSSGKNKTSKYANVHFSNATDKWISQIQIKKTKISIGSFDSEEIAYDKLKEYKLKNGIE
jgi:hypothetical protein